MAAVWLMIPCAMRMLGLTHRRRVLSGQTALPIRGERVNGLIGRALAPILQLVRAQ